MNLSDMKPGEKACITSLSVKSPIRRRLLDIGLIEGTKIECVGKSPCGDPKAFLIRSAVIALRNDDSRNIKVCKWD